MERSEEHTSELQSLRHLVCRLLLEKKKQKEQGVHAVGADLDVGFFHGGAVLPQIGMGQQLIAGPGIDLAGLVLGVFFFLNDAAPPEFYTLSLPDALPI